MITVTNPKLLSSQTTDQAKAITAIRTFCVNS